VNDNIVVYFPGHKLLFGGCLVRANTAEGLGYVIDSDLDNWDDAVKAVAKRFADADVVVPGHGEPGGRGLLSHTLTLLDMRSGGDPQ
jgi:glyoxylase-like metal-dependent hydrolase (beta-lactamase superfamily II)